MCVCRGDRWLLRAFARLCWYLRQPQEALQESALLGLVFHAKLEPLESQMLERRLDFTQIGLLNYELQIEAVQSIAPKGKRQESRPQAKTRGEL